MRKRFYGQLDALTKLGASYVNQQRFTPLHNQGKPLWEFKEHDHRLYCVRIPKQATTLEIVLFSGWVKQKSGKTGKEDRAIEHAKTVYEEFMKEYQGGNI